MPLRPAQRQYLEEWLRSKAIVRCPTCGHDKWRLGDAACVRTLLEEGEPDLTERAGW